MPGKKLNRKSAPAPRKRIKRRVRPVRIAGMTAPRSAAPKPVVDHLRMLHDPCGAPMTKPVYSGTDSGYLFRTVDHISLTNGGGNLTGKYDFLYTYCPAKGPGNAHAIASGSTGTSLGFAIQSVSNFISGASVAKYRPVAACARFVPTGNYNTRSGLIFDSVTSGDPGYPGTLFVNNAVAGAMRRVPLGSETHEVRWLPTESDESFTTTAANAPGFSGGYVVLGGLNVDGATAATGTVSVSGYIETTTIWEWIPTTYATGNAFSASPPTPYKLNDVLSKIRNIAEFATGVASSAGYKEFSSLISGGIKAIETAMPMMAVV